MKVVEIIYNYRVKYTIYRLGNRSYIVKFIGLDGAERAVNIIFDTVEDAKAYINGLRVIDKLMSMRR